MRSVTFALPWKKLIRLSLAFVFVCLPVGSLFAETEQQKVSEIILDRDAKFWEVYNHCETEKFGQFFTEDVEFYHDRGGTTFGRENLVASLKTNLCGNPDYRLRREGVEGSVRVFPLQKDNVTYGAVISGEHQFYILEKGKTEYLDGLAKFFHVWILKDDGWRMSRVVSYDHGPALYVNKRMEAKVPVEALDQLVGNYIGPQSGAMNVQKEGNSLILLVQNGKSNYVLYPESESLFFQKERDLTFEFVRSAKDRAIKMIVREHGEIIETAERSK